MIHLFEKQARQEELFETEKRIKQDLALCERINAEDKRDNLRKIPFYNEGIRKDLQNNLEKYQAKKCEDNIRKCEEALGREIGN